MRGTLNEGHNDAQNGKHFSLIHSCETKAIVRQESKRKFKPWTKYESFWEKYFQSIFEFILFKEADLILPGKRNKNTLEYYYFKWSAANRA